MKNLFVGIDLGTTTVKAGLFDCADGRRLALASRETELLTPERDRVEYQPAGYIDAVSGAINEALENAPRDRIGGAGLSSQGQTFIALDAEDRSLGNIIVWLDNRAGEEAEELRRAAGGEFNTICSGSKWLWMARHEPQLHRRLRKIMMLPEYVAWLLTGARGVDPCNAGSTHCVDRDTESWDIEKLRLCRVEPGWVGEIIPTCGHIGDVHSDGQRLSGLPAGTPVFAGSNDQLDGAIGVGNDRRGVVSGAIGTSTALIANLGDSKPSRSSRFNWGRYPVRGQYYALTYGKTGANLLTWFRNNFAPDEPYEKIIAEADAISPGCDGVLCAPHFQGVATPSFRHDVRGGFAGLSLSHSRAHLARAIMEAVCYSARDSLELVSPVAGEIRRLILIGGATKSEVWLQMMADALGIPAELPVETEAATLGAALIASVGAGYHPALPDAMARCARIDRRFEPDMNRNDMYSKIYMNYRELMEKLYPGAL